VTEVVLRVFPTPKTTLSTLRIAVFNSTSSREFYAMLGFLHAELARLKKGGMQGYYLVAGPPAVPTLSFSWTSILFDKPRGTVVTLMHPIETYLADRAELFTHHQTIKHAATYLAIYNNT
jgi:hypothetical protein